MSDPQPIHKIQVATSGEPPASLKLQPQEGRALIGLGDEGLQAGVLVVAELDYIAGRHPGWDYARQGELPEGDFVVEDGQLRGQGQRALPEEGLVLFTY